MARRPGWFIRIELYAHEPDAGMDEQLVKTEEVPVLANMEQTYPEVMNMVVAAATLLQRPVRGDAPFEPVDPSSPVSVWAAGVLEASRVFKNFALVWQRGYEQYITSEEAKRDADISAARGLSDVRGGARPEEAEEAARGGAAHTEDNTQG